MPPFGLVHHVYRLPMIKSKVRAGLVVLLTLILAHLARSSCVSLQVNATAKKIMTCWVVMLDTHARRAHS